MRTGQPGFPANDVTGGYEWSLDLAHFRPSGATLGGTTVQLTPSPDDPVPGITTVAVTVTGETPSDLFLRVVATWNL